MQKSFICLLQTYINEEKFSSFQNVMMLKIESKIQNQYTFNCFYLEINQYTMKYQAKNFETQQEQQQQHRIRKNMGTKNLGRTWTGRVKVEMEK